MTYADNGFGDLVEVRNPFGFTTTVYTRINGVLASFEAGTQDHAQAIAVVRKSLHDVRLSADRWKNGPVLAVVPSKRASQ